MTQNNKELLNAFLKEFGAETIKDLPIERYSNNGRERNDFTYWLEWKLDCFGGIKGGSSYKFGIFKTNERPLINRQGYSYDSSKQYAWVTKYGNTVDDAFGSILKEIETVINIVSQETIDFDRIESVELGDAVKWKIAFLYSDYHLVPVYKKEVLITASKRLGILNRNSSSLTISELQKQLVAYFNNNPTEYKNDICFFGNEVWRIGTLDLFQSNQIIKYGAPGTGKTFTAKKDAEDFFEIWKLDVGNTSLDFADHYGFVQFHPSYSYEDFIEGIKPVLDTAGNSQLKLKDGVFKAFCKKAAKYDLWLLKEFGKDIDKITVEKVREKEDSPFKWLDGANNDDLISKYIPPFFFLIDEINRADLSRVFGELMYCLEYRGYKGRIKTQYSELESGDTIFYKDITGHYFFIPNNVYIIGTMNTIDRSIESFDFALRRRFVWQRIDPNKDVLQKYFQDKEEESLGNFIIPCWVNLNKAIENEPLLGPDYQIGHSYLMKLDKYPEQTNSSYRDIIWEKHIYPILEEYFRGMGPEAKKRIGSLKDKFCKKENG